jgi:hypothetical protein
MRSETGLLDYIDEMAPPVSADEAIARRQHPSPGQGRGLAWALAAFAVVLTVAGLYLAFSGDDGQVVNQTTVLTSTTLVEPEPESGFLGNWVSFDGTRTMIISEVGTVEMTGHDDFASACSGAPATMTGTGRLLGDTTLVVDSPGLTCDDGSDSVYEVGGPIDQQLENLTFTYYPESDTLTDSLELNWVWERASPESATPPLSDAEITEFLNGFLEARIAGDGALQFVAQEEEDIPLLYATSSGASYERGEFQPHRRGASMITTTEGAARAVPTKAEVFRKSRREVSELDGVFITV